MARSRRNDEDEDTGSGGGEELSIRKKDRSEGGGGLADDIDCKIVSARLSMRSKSNYQDADPEGACCLMVKFESEVEGFETFTEYYSAGSNVVPGDKGKRMMRAPGSKGDFRNNTKMARFLDSLTDAGLSEDDQYPFDKLDGLDVHVNRKADEKREGLEDGDGSGRNKKRTILLVTDLLDEDEDEGQKSKSKGKAKTKAKAKPAADDDEDEPEDDDSAADDDDEDDKPAAKSKGGKKGGDPLLKKAIATVAKISAGKEFDDVADVYTAAFRALKGDDDRAAIMRDHLNEDDLPGFLKTNAEAGGWTFAKGKLVGEE